MLKHLSVVTRQGQAMSQSEKIDSFDVTQINGFVHMGDADASLTFCGLLIIDNRDPEENTPCCPICIQALGEKTGLSDIEKLGGGQELQDRYRKEHLHLNN